MAKKVIYICDICRNESINAPNFDMDGKRGRCKITIEGYTRKMNADGTYKHYDINEKLMVVCWQCSDSIGRLISKLKRKK